MFNMSQNKFTDNEVNNMVYLGLKYACGYGDPRNESIDMVVLEIGDGRTIENIIERTIQHARLMSGANNIDFKTSERKREMEMLLIGDKKKRMRGFCDLPESVRNDLGRDTDYDKFITRH